MTKIETIEAILKLDETNLRKTELIEDAIKVSQLWESMRP